MLLTEFQKNYDLNQLLHEVLRISVNHNKKITGISIDSRTTRAGNLFCAYSGVAQDGRLYIDDAIQKGAVAILCEENENDVCTGFRALPGFQPVPIFYVKQLKQKIGPLASHFFGDPSSKMTVVGVTGTNGKTTITHLIAQALAHFSKKCAVVGTLGNGFLENLNTTINTTADPVTVHACLDQAYLFGARIAAMEVTSHALDQSRVNGVTFTQAIFSNLSRDHLDYHGTLENYGQAKRRLFVEPLIPQAIINVDCPFGETLIHELHNQTDVIAYSVNKNNRIAKNIPVIYAARSDVSLKGISAELNTPWGTMDIHSTLLGHYNLSNLLAVCASLGSMKFSLNEIADAVLALKPVPGRMESFQAPHQPTVIVDYAHTPDALSNVLSTLSENKKGRLICVFGCGGNRDRGKRPLMAQAAERYCDHIIVTDDNVRLEDPELIFNDIKAGFKNSHKVIYEHDRKQAIKKAITGARPADTVLIAGKGHETYQIIGDVKHYFSDAEVVSALVKE